MAQADEPMLFTGTYLETSIVLFRKRGCAVEAELDRMIEELGIQIIPVTPAQARLGREALQRFGKGQHLARLNFGDCFAYALANSRILPILFKSNDFSRTDLESA
jgi:ribonuclease VapC